MKAFGENTVIADSRERNISSEANTVIPLGDIKRMARRRYQRPTPKRIGNWWFIRVRVDERGPDGERVRVRKWIPLCGAETRVRQVAKIADEYLQKNINKGTVSVAGISRIGEYIDSDYNRDLDRLAKPVQDCYCGMIEKHIRPYFANKCFREVSSCDIEDFFYRMKKTGANYPTMAKVWDTLSSIFRSAHRRHAVDSNPMEEAEKPKDDRIRRRKPTISPEQFQQILTDVAEPYATMVYVAVWTGLRVSELLGLKWRCISEDSITIEERYWRGDWAKTKTERSAATIAAHQDVIRRILELKNVTVQYRAGRATRKVNAVRACGPDDVVFQSVWKGKPMNEGNVLRRHVKPAARALGLDFVDWRCMRRSHSTWLVQSGADPKSVQGQMRHARISTTMDIYAQVVPEAQHVAIGQLSDFIAKHSSSHGPVMGQNSGSVSGPKSRKVVSIR